jgi:hypothetical protein
MKSRRIVARAPVAQRDYLTSFDIDIKARTHALQFLIMNELISRTESRVDQLLERLRGMQARLDVIDDALCALRDRRPGDTRALGSRLRARSGFIAQIGNRA